MPDQGHADSAFVVVPEWAIDDALLSDGAFRLYALLLTYADSESATAWPSRKTLGRRLRCSVDTVDRRIKELVSVRALVVTARYDDDGDRTSNLYTMHRIRADNDRASAATPVAAPVRQRTRPSPSEPEGQQPQASAAQPAKKPRKRGPRDDIFDALVAAFGPASTKSRAAFYGRTVGQLLDVGATPEQIRHARIVISRRGWDSPSPEAMLKHWDSLIADDEGPSNPAARRFWEESQSGQ